MKRNPAHYGSAYHLALFVSSLIALVILVALVIKVFLLFQQSSFDGRHQYIVEVQEPQQTRFFVLNPDSQSANTLLVEGIFPSSPMLALGVPIDATMVSSSDIASFSDLGNALLLRKNELHASTTIVDAVNIFIFLHTLTKTTTQHTLSADQQDTLFSHIFVDASVYKEGESVAIVNGTDVAGVGNKIARLFAHIGANVVSVTTADVPTPTSSVEYVGNSSYTASRLSRILHLPLVHLSRTAISDITVVLGRDRATAFGQ